MSSPVWAAASLPPPPPASAATAGLVAPGPRFSTSPCADGTLDLAITERPPGRCDDAAHGFSAGRLKSLVMENGGGTGATTVTCAVSAPAASLNSRTATCHATLSGGVVTGYVVDDGGQGYTDAQSTTVTVTTDGTAVVAPAPVVEPPTLWNYGGVLFQPLDLTARTAVWTQVNGDAAAAAAQAPLPVDALVAASGQVPVFCGGTFRHYSVYSAAGSAFDVTRASDSTVKTIALTPTGIADTPGADTFCAGTTCTVTKLYNQCVPGNDATSVAATGAQWAGNRVGRLPAITLATFAGSTFGPRFMSLSASTALTPGLMSVAMLARQRASFSSSYAIGMNGSTPATLFTYAPGSMAGMRTPGGNGGLPATVSPDVHEFVTNGGSLAMTNNMTFAAKNTIAAAPSGTYTDGQIGANLSGYNGGGQDIASVILTSGTGSGVAWNVAQQKAVQNSLILWGNLKPQTRNVFAVSGDSIGAGYGGNYNRHWANQLMDTTYPGRWYNNGAPGQAMTFSMGNFSTVLAREYDRDAPNFVVLGEDGINDFIASNSPAATVEAQIGGPAVLTASGNVTAGFAQAIKGLGANVRYLVQTIPEPCGATVTGLAACPKITTAQQALWAPYNPWLRLNWNAPAASGGLGADALVDIAGQPLMAAAVSPLIGAIAYTTTATTSDGLHPLNAGGAIYVPPYAAALKAVLQ